MLLRRSGEPDLCRAAGERKAHRHLPCCRRCSANAQALLLDSRSIRNIPAIFWRDFYAGCAYAPLDIAMPPRETRLLLELMQPSAVLVDERSAGVFAARGCAASR